MKFFLMTAFTLTGIARFFGVTPPSDGEFARVYVGTYTGSNSEGIYVLDLDLTTGQLTRPRLAAKTDNPSFLAIHSSGDYLYAVNEIGDWKGLESGAVSAFAIDPKSGRLKLVNQQSSGGGAPCYLIVDKSGRFVLVANYGGGSVASLPIGDDGQLGEAASIVQHEGSSINPDRQEGPHAHSINLDAGGQYALAADLGLDEVLVYRFDAESGKLARHDPPSASVTPGAGPRHLSFHPNGQLAYVINELNLTISVFTYNSESGTLTPAQTISTLPDSATSDEARASYSTAEIRVHPSGRFAYASNRGHDTIAVFAVDGSSGNLALIEHEPTLGRTPRNFEIDPTGQFLVVANQDSNNLVVFRIDQETGHLEPTGSRAEVPSPVCIKFPAR